MRQLPQQKETTFDKIFKNAEPDAVDLIRKMLTFDPQKRITVEEALKHPYLKNLHFEEDEPSAEFVSAFDFDFELYNFKKDEYKELIYQEIMLYHDEDAIEQYLKDKNDHPDGMLNKKYGKEKMRKMYKTESKH